ncbi:hypothetical protein [Cellulomonas sp. P5_C5]
MTEPLNPTVTGGGVTLVVPQDWEQVDLPGTQLAIAGPPFVLDADGTTFRPSMNVLVADAAPEADIRMLGTEAVAAAHVVAEGVHVLAYDMWASPDEKRGRRLQFTYQQGDVPLYVVQWIVLRDAVVTTLTATYPVAQLLRVHQLCEDVASLALGPRPAR